MDQYDGFREFFETRRQALSRTAFLLTGEHAAAEDLLQEALTKTLRRWNRLSADGSAEGYIRAVMLNQVRSQWRVRHRGAAEFPTSAPVDTPAQQDLSSDAVQRTLLAEALRRLSPRQRAVLYLRFYEDLSEAETADILAAP